MSGALHISKWNALMRSLKDMTPWRQALNQENVHYGSYYERSVQYRAALILIAERDEMCYA